VLVLVGIAVALKMIPSSVMTECRDKAQAAMNQGKPTNRAAAVGIVAIWLLLAALAVVIVARVIQTQEILQ